MSSETSNSTDTYVPCTLQTCSVSTGTVPYQPNVGGNAFYATLFATFLVIQLYLGIRTKTWSFTVPMLFGLILEIAGYIGRILLHDNPWDFNLFILQVRLPRSDHTLMFLDIWSA